MAMQKRVFGIVANLQGICHEIDDWVAEQRLLLRSRAI